MGPLGVLQNLYSLRRVLLPNLGANLLSDKSECALSLFTVAMGFVCDGTNFLAGSFQFFVTLSVIS